MTSLPPLPPLPPRPGANQNPAPQQASPQPAPFQGGQPQNAPQAPAFNPQQGGYPQAPQQPQFEQQAPQQAYAQPYQQQAFTGPQIGQGVVGLHEGFMARWMKKALPLMALVLVVVPVVAFFRNSGSISAAIVGLIIAVFSLGLAVGIIFIMTKTVYAPVIIDFNTGAITIRGTTQAIQAVTWARLKNINNQGTQEITLEFGFNEKQKTTLVLNSRLVTAKVDEVEIVQALIPYTSIPLTSDAEQGAFGGAKMLVGKNDIMQLLAGWLQAQREIAAAKASN